MPWRLRPRSTSLEMSASSARKDPLECLQQQHLAAQARKRRGDLGARGAAADDREAARHLGQRPRLLGADHPPAELHPGNRPRQRPGREHHALRGVGLSADGHRAVGLQRAGALEHVDPVFAEQPSHTRGERLHDLVPARPDRGVVDLDRACVDPELGPLAHLGEEVRRAQHRLGRDAGVVQAAPAELVALDHGRASSELGGAQRRHVTAWPRADDYAVVGALGHAGAQPIEAPSSARPPGCAPSPARASRTASRPARSPPGTRPPPERRGHRQRERGDEDLEGEQGLEAEHRPVAPACHPDREHHQHGRQQRRPRQRAAVAGEVVDGQRADDHADRQQPADGDRDQQRGRALVGAQRAELGPRLLVAACSTFRPARGRAARGSRTARAPPPRAPPSRRSRAARTRAWLPRPAPLPGCRRRGPRSRRTGRSRSRPRSAPARAQPPGGRAWWASRAPGPPRCSRRRRDRPRRSPPGLWVERPTSMSGPTISRTSCTREVVLSDVDPVGPGLGRHRGAVVDDQQRPEPLAQRRGGRGDGRELVVGELLLAQLHDVHAARHRGADQVGKLDSSAGPRPGRRRTRGTGASAASRSRRSVCWAVTTEGLSVGVSQSPAGG